jgi:hypothetical protein
MLPARPDQPRQPHCVKVVFADCNHTDNAGVWEAVVTERAVLHKALNISVSH